MEQDLLEVHRELGRLRLELLHGRQDGLVLLERRVELGLHLGVVPDHPPVLPVEGVLQALAHGLLVGGIEQHLVLLRHGVVEPDLDLLPTGVELLGGP